MIHGDILAMPFDSLLIDRYWDFLDTTYITLTHQTRSSSSRILRNMEVFELYFSSGTWAAPGSRALIIITKHYFFSQHFCGSCSCLDLWIFVLLLTAFFA